MDRKGLLTLALLGISVLAGTALALGVGRPPRGENQGVKEIRAEMTEDARGPGRALFSVHKCVTCHGPDGGGTAMGPGLGAVMQEYIAAAGGDLPSAKQRIVRYLKQPKGVPTLRRDSARYPNPMPSAKGLGLDEKKMADLAEFLIHMKPPSVAGGGNASER